MQDGVGALDTGSVERWRQEQLEDAGFPHAEAFLLAKHSEVDVHEACDLLARGCPVSVAVRILT